MRQITERLDHQNEELQRQLEKKAEENGILSATAKAEAGKFAALQFEFEALKTDLEGQDIHVSELEEKLFGMDAEQHKSEETQRRLAAVEKQKERLEEQLERKAAKIMELEKLLRLKDETYMSELRQFSSNLVKLNQTQQEKEAMWNTREEKAAERARQEMRIEREKLVLESVKALHLAERQRDSFGEDAKKSRQEAENRAEKIRQDAQTITSLEGRLATAENEKQVAAKELKRQVAESGQRQGQDAQAIATLERRLATAENAKEVSEEELKRRVSELSQRQSQDTQTIAALESRIAAAGDEKEMMTEERKRHAHELEQRRSQDAQTIATLNERLAAAGSEREEMMEKMKRHESELRQRQNQAAEATRTFEVQLATVKNAASEYQEASARGSAKLAAFVDGFKGWMGHAELTPDLRRSLEVLVSGNVPAEEVGMSLAPILEKVLVGCRRSRAIHIPDSQETVGRNTESSRFFSQNGEPLSQHNPSAGRDSISSLKTHHLEGAHSQASTIGDWKSSAASQERMRQVSVKSPANDQAIPTPRSVVDEKRFRREAQQPKPIIKPTMQAVQTSFPDGNVSSEGGENNTFTRIIDSRFLSERPALINDEPKAPSTAHATRLTRSKSSQKDPGLAAKDSSNRRMSRERTWFEHSHLAHSEGSQQREEVGMGGMTVVQLAPNKTQSTTPVVNGMGPAAHGRKASRGRQPAANKGQGKVKTESTIEADQGPSPRISDIPEAKKGSTSQPQVTKLQRQRTYGSQKTTDSALDGDFGPVFPNLSRRNLVQSQ